MIRSVLRGSEWRGLTAAPLVAATLLGAAYAVHDGHRLRLVPLLLCAAAAFAAQRGVSALMTLLDPAGDTGPAAPLDRRAQAAAGIGAALVLGLGVSLLTGPGVFLAGVAGLVLAVALVAPPLPAAYLGSGIGEGVVGVLAGPIPVVAAHLAQGGAIHSGILLASLPAGLLAVGTILVAERERRIEDASAGLPTLAVLLGESGARLAPHAAFVGACLALLAGVGLEELPRSALAALAAVPVTAWTAERAPRLTGALAAVTIGVVAAALFARRF